MAPDLSVDLRFHTEDRGYAITLAPDLFGDLILTRRWWGRHNGRGNHKLEFVPDPSMAIKRLQQELARRKSHGYSCSNPGELWELMLLMATPSEAPTHRQT